MKRSTLPLALTGAALLTPPLLYGLGLWIGSEFFMRSYQLERPYRLKVLELGEDTVTLDRSDLSARTGEFRLEWAADDAKIRWHRAGVTQGYGVVGEILELSERWVKRRFVPVLGVPRREQFVRMRPYALEDNPLRSCGLEYHTVGVSSELGSLPAWFVPHAGSSGKTWAILIHGRSGGPQEFVHALPTLHHAGLPILALTYRNHGDAPRSPDGMHHHGHREWKDVEASLEYALAHGAEQVVLYGVSMGGNLCLTTLRRSPLASHIQALVLDCPALNYHAVLELHAEQMKLSSRSARAIARLSEWRSGWALSEVNHRDDPRPLGVPTLLVHGDLDVVVPIGSSDHFAELHRDEVKYLRVKDADHIQSWNVAGPAYRAALRDLLERSSLPRPLVPPHAVQAQSTS